MKRRRNDKKIKKIRRSRVLRASAGDLQPLLAAATEAHRRGDLQAAERGYLEALRCEPASGVAWNALGTVLMDGNRLEEAEQAFDKASCSEPSHAPALYNLGRLRQLRGDFHGALTAYEALIKEEPGYGPAWNNLGTVHRALGDPDLAFSCFSKAVKYEPEMAEAWNNLGVAMDREDRTAEAMEAYKKALGIRPDYPSAHFNLGLLLQKIGNYAGAEEHYRKVLESLPEHASAQYMLQSLGALENPAAAPIDYVRGVFDECANTFERTLVAKLKYTTPELLFALVKDLLTPGIAILDLGCGTGLGSEFYRPFARRMVGVDISRKMLEKAWAKGTYDRVKEMDILRDWDFDEKFDLICATDVFVYVGDLSPAAASSSLFLNPGGHLAFSVEILDGDVDGYRLLPTARFAHSHTYVQRVMAGSGLTITRCEETVLRQEAGQPVAGLLVVAQKTS
jgi:predicted TPR repeat methyltransferase